jgi:hypothetical protein
MSKIGFGLLGLATKTWWKINQKEVHVIVVRKFRRGGVYLENVESLKLNIAGFFLQHVHHKFQVIRIRYVLGHHLKLEEKLVLKQETKFS